VEVNVVHERHDEALDRWYAVKEMEYFFDSLGTREIKLLKIALGRGAPDKKDYEEVKKLRDRFYSILDRM
jgi:hypothetical protein